MNGTRRIWWTLARVLAWGILAWLVIQAGYFLVGFIWVMIEGIPPESWDI